MPSALSYSKCVTGFDHIDQERKFPLLVDYESKDAIFAFSIF